jgi:hypothetical protein
MKIKTFQNFVNESRGIALPQEAKEFARLVKGGQWKPHYDLDGVFSYHLRKGNLQINFDTTGDWGGGIQISDEDGNDLYQGENPKDAAAVVKKNI